MAAPTIVQSAFTRANGGNSTITITLGSTPTPGNTLLFFDLGGPSALPPSGLTAIQGTRDDSFNQALVYKRVVQSGDGTAWVFPAMQDIHNLAVFELAGATGFVAAHGAGAAVGNDFTTVALAAASASTLRFFGWEVDGATAQSSIQTPGANPVPYTGLSPAGWVNPTATSHAAAIGTIDPATVGVATVHCTIAPVRPVWVDVQALSGTGHRYWRIYITGPTPQGIGRLELRATPGGANMATIAANWSASSQDTNGGGFTYNAHNVIDGATDNDIWATILSFGDGWIAYDFGASAPQDIREIQIKARTVATTQTPTTFRVMYSDDNVTWFTKYYVIGAPAWTASEIRTFTFPDPTVARRYWRINILTNDYGSFPSISEVVMTATIGGATAIGSGTPTASSTHPSTTGPGAACDGNAATWWTCNNSSGPTGWWQYDFGVGKQVVQELKLTARNTGVVDASTAPRTFTMDCTDDVITWAQAQNDVASVWASGGTQTFDTTPWPAPPVVGGGTGAKQLLIMG